ncbi:unnamed protein product [Sphagnum jensenii]|uniref:Uncharacterized protein n=1 Tax=Sphagnum jensenii TaxID=128206 RepID=A0ABP1AN55_9BRYO
MMRFGRLVRGAIQVLRGRAPDDVIRHQTMVIQEQTSQLQEARAAKEKKLEDEALLKLQSVVEEMQQLKESLIAVEAAAVEHVDQIAKEAETQLQEDWSRKESTIVGGDMEGQQIEAGVNPAEQIQADLSLKESVEDSQCYTKSSQVPVNSSDKVVTPSP